MRFDVAGGKARHQDDAVAVVRYPVNLALHGHHP